MIFAIGRTVDFNTHPLSLSKVVDFLADELKKTFGPDVKKSSRKNAKVKMFQLQKTIYMEKKT